MKRRMKRLLNFFGQSESVFILDTHGDIVATKTDDIQIKNYGTRDFFKKAIHGDTYVSEPAVDRGKGTFIIVRPSGIIRKKL